MLNYKIPMYSLTVVLTCTIQLAEMVKYQYCSLLLCFHLLLESQAALLTTESANDDLAKFKASDVGKF